VDKPLYHISAVSYLNTKPFLYGLYSSPLIEYLDIQLDPPAVCAEKLREGAADLALIPVGALVDLPEHYIISDYCIGAQGAVKTVGLFSQVPLENIETVMLDYQSRTSVALIQVLMKNHWKKQVQYIGASPGFTEQIKGNQAAVVIGDKTMDLLEKHPYVYDLSEVWEKYTDGLPFVFAVWVSKRPMDPLFVALFNKALEQGVNRISDLIKILPNTHPGFSIKHYLENNISYSFDDRKKEALSRFLHLIKKN
jgi:chorismate dehydratase